MAASPFATLSEKYGVQVDFRPFFRIEPLSSREFRAQRINLSEFTAIVFSSKSTIDAYFHMCEELRVKVPETMKYYCTSESVAKYLQKHIVYRKRKVFFGSGTAESLVREIGLKHNGEKFLVTTSETPENEITRLFAKEGVDFTPAVFVKPVSQDIKDIDLDSYDVIALYNAADVRSLYENFPEYSQGSTHFISFGRSIVKAMEDAGLKIAISAPTAEVPSVYKAVEILLEEK